MNTVTYVGYRCPRCGDIFDADEPVPVSWDGLRICPYDADKSNSYLYRTIYTVTHGEQETRPLA